MRLALRSLLVVALGQVVMPPVAGQVLSTNLLYTAIQPCRLFDTRLAGGAIQPGSANKRTFNVVGVSAPGSLTSQGGSASGCPIPGFSGTTPKVQAVMINVVAVGPAGAGDLRAWPSDQPTPSSSIINYSNVSGLNIANGVAVAVRQDSQGADITLQADVSATHVLGDVLGYFTKASRRFYLTTATFNGSQTLTACAAGFHFASIYEILHPDLLVYDATLGVASPDGAGPPQATGWVRTGGASSGFSGVAGQDNCQAWTATIGAGSTATNLGAPWSNSPTFVSPWTAGVGECFAGGALNVWCVED